ncbi:hypothetical protein ACK8HH_18825 (plasmid) [Gordonia sp. LUNF6]|jgi:hypothetical protein|nr:MULTISPECIES: hypothetical protein [Mycobacteriales]MCR8897638.1 hypothetical protein [Gordonia sp. GONU]
MASDDHHGGAASTQTHAESSGNSSTSVEPDEMERRAIVDRIAD